MPTSNPEDIFGMAVTMEKQPSAAGLYNPSGHCRALPTRDCKPQEFIPVSRGTKTIYTCSTSQTLSTDSGSPCAAEINVEVGASGKVYEVAVQQENGGGFRSLPLSGNLTSPDLSSIDVGSSSWQESVNKFVNDHAGGWDAVKTTGITGAVMGMVPVFVEATAERFVPERRYIKLAEKLEEMALKKWADKDSLPSEEQKIQIKKNAKIAAKAIVVAGIREGVTFGFNTAWSFVSPVISGAKEVVTGKWLGAGFKAGAGAFAIASSQLATSYPTASMVCGALSVGCRVGAIAVPAYANPVGTVISAVSGAAGNLAAQGLVCAAGRLAKSKTPPVTASSPLLSVASHSPVPGYH